MKSTVSMVLLAGVLAVPFAASAQEVAGRVIVAVGDVTLARGTQKIPAQRGTEVRTGDTLQLGTASNAQVLFTDQSVIALRQDTQFRVSEYAFKDNNPETGRAFFDLVKGGMRTVTGLIGKRHHENYGVRTLTSTIGIRGTNYSLVQCDNSCRHPDGSLAPNGTYGGVTDGRISVTNQSGEHVFGHDQYFYVASPAIAPQPLIAPPGFLRDQLEGRSRASGKQKAAANGQQEGPQQGQQQQSTTAPTSDPGVAASTSTTTPATALTTNTYQVTNEISNPGGITTILAPTFSGTLFYRIAGNLNIVPTTCGTPPCNTFVLGEITLGVNYAAGRATVGVNLQSDKGEIFNFGTPPMSGGVPITLNGSQVVFGGTLNLADYPLNQGAFRCSGCGPNNTPGFASQLTISGTIDGATATVTLSAVDSGGGGSLTATLPQVTLPNNSAAAVSLPGLSTGGGAERSNAYWNVQLGSSGQLVDFGPMVGAAKGNAGAATNTIVGGAPTYGNLVWGTWGPGAQITDFNYVTGTTTTVTPWITGDATNSIPSTLGTQTFTVIPSAWIVNNGAGTVNSGTLTADFVNRNINLSLNVSRTSGALNTFQMNGSGAFNPTTSRFSQGFNSVTCSGPCTGSAPSGGFAGFFAGPQAEGAGVAFNAGTGISGQGVTGVVGMKR